MQAINAGDTAFVLICTALVCMMTPALALFYGGLVKQRDVLSIMIQNFVCIGIVSIIWVFGGFSLAFGPSIGGIIGGNMFDALFVSASDIAYREGSIFHAIGERTLFWMALVTVMTAILLMGLLRREKQGPAGIGWESVLLLLIWLAAAGLQVALG